MHFSTDSDGWEKTAVGVELRFCLECIYAFNQIGIKRENNYREGH